MAELFGYAGKMLRVDLSTGRLSDEALDEAIVRRWVGGAGLGAHYLYEEVAPALHWSDAANRLILATGPLAGTRVSGSGTFSVASKGAMTNMAASTQANGFFGAFLKFCGYDGIIIQGAAPDWVYLHVNGEGPSLRDARFLLGKDTWEIEDAVVAANGDRKYSVFCIGPAGEHLVRFAAIAGDRGHVAGHNGVGAVMGSKKLKAVAIARGKRQVPVFDRNSLSAAVKQTFDHTVEASTGAMIYRWGTAGLLSNLHRTGGLPVKNYTTSIFPEHERIDGHYTRTRFQHKKMPCWACQIGCCQMTTVTEGPYAGYVGEEPEYEGYATCSSVIGQTDPGAAVMLANLIDRLGFDMNESGWVIGFAMECYEKGLITKADTGGLELSWGNAEAAAALLRQIAHREGFGALFADGVRVAAERIGGEALSFAIYTMKGNSPRTHDHRARWDELIDTCMSNTGTIECCGGFFDPRQLGLEPVSDQFSWAQVSTMNTKLNGRRLFTDTLGICRFNFEQFIDEVESLNLVTGRRLTIPDAMTIGRRIINQLRVFNLRCGLTPAMEAPSPRYASVPLDGPAAGQSILEHWDAIRRNHYHHMGWDEDTGRPLPDTLQQLGLANLLPDLAALAPA